MKKEFDLNRDHDPLRNQILKDQYSTDTCYSEFDDLNLHTLFRLPENGELSVAPQSMTSDSLL